MMTSIDMTGPIGDYRGTLIDAGLLPGDIVPDGKIRRCGTVEHPKKDNGWQVLHADPFAGAYGDWSTGKSFTWNYSDDSLSYEEKKQLQRQIEVNVH